jgi:hypothetical protein
VDKCPSSGFVKEKYYVFVGSKTFLGNTKEQALREFTQNFEITKRILHLFMVI